MHKYLLGIALACLAVPSFADEGTPRRYTIEQLMDSDVIGGLSWSPDDSKLIFTSNRTGIANIYEMPSGGGTPSEPEISASPATKTVAGVRVPVLPLDAYAVDAQQQEVLDRAVDELAETCMKAKGYTWPARLKQLGVPRSANERRYGVTSCQSSPRPCTLTVSPSASSCTVVAPRRRLDNAIRPHSAGRCGVTVRARFGTCGSSPRNDRSNSSGAALAHACGEHDVG